MAATIYRPCYCTRESVMRELDIKATAYDTTMIDRKIVAASESVESVTQRKFYVQQGTRKFDWPNFQYAWPWVLWLDQHELAGIPSLVVSGTFLPNPVNIPIANCIFRPINDGPPYTKMELRRDLNSAFGNNTTPQLDIAITGPFGYWQQTEPAGALAASMGTGDTTLQTTIGSGAAAGAGVGDVIIADSESMIITDSSYVSTGVTFSAGLASSPPSMADNSITVPSGGAFSADETIAIDAETMLIQQIIGNNLVVKRAFDGSVIATHATGGTIFAKRQLTVLRGQLGTSAATHNNAAPLSVSAVPGMVRELAVAEAVTSLVQGRGGYNAAEMPTWYGITGRTGGQQREQAAGLGLAGLRDRVQARYGRQVRSRVI